MKARILPLLLILTVSLYAAVAVQAQGPGQPTADQVNAIAKKLYCPVCPNTPLDVCETKACQDWRDQIKDQLTAGWSEEQIIDFFVTQYGERVVAEPQRSGFTSLVWLLPVIAIALGLAVVTQVLRSWKTGRLDDRPSPAGPVVEPSPETLERVERELRELW